ncbi:restriction endonuclease subunit S [Soonwooa purpurea]
MKRYEAYKDSGVDWIGEIPEGWEVLSNKYIFNLKKSQVGKRSNEYDLLSLTLKGVIKRDMENPEGKFPAEFDTYQEVKKNDFIFCLFDVEETPRTVGLSDFDGMITGAYTVFDTKPTADKKFLYYFYLNLDEKKRLKFLYRGLRNTIPKDSFFSFKTIFPPLSEQTAIAEFLDDKTAKIDQTIGIRQKEIELLKERRQILIQQAVTKGLDATVPMKDSGVDWIGEIPEHWEVRKLKTLSKKIVDGTHFTPNYIDEGIPFLRVTDLTNMQSGVIQWEKVNRISVEEHKSLIKRAFGEKGDVLLSKNGTIGLTKVIDWDEEFSFFVSLCLIKLRKEINPHYFTYFFNSPLVDEQLNFGSSRTSVTNLHLEKIKELLIVLPPINEQDKIIKAIDELTNPIAKAISIKEQEIEKLKEYKTVLIDQVVTGKVKTN